MRKLNLRQVSYAAPRSSIATSSVTKMSADRSIGDCTLRSGQVQNYYPMIPVGPCIFWIVARAALSIRMLPLPMQKFCCVEFTLCRGSLGGLDGNVSFGLTVRPPKAYCMMGEYPGSYGYSSDGAAAESV